MFKKTKLWVWATAAEGEESSYAAELSLDSFIRQLATLKGVSNTGIHHNRKRWLGRYVDYYYTELSFSTKSSEAVMALISKFALKNSKEFPLASFKT